MKALSMSLPWSNFVRDGLKTIETRVWKTNYRGELLICSAKSIDEHAMYYFSHPKFNHYPKAVPIGEPKAVALCVAELYDCREMVEADEDQALCAVYTRISKKGRIQTAKSFFLRNIKPIKPFAVIGQLNIFELDIKPEDIIYL
jgi:hypothetical protein